MGYLHAQDRFFQMDVFRRQASGTLSELIGVGTNDQVLRTDVQLRTFGLRRAAIRSRDVYSSRSIGILQAYAAGVNAWLDTNELPPEYAALEITNDHVPRWDIIDSIAVAKLLAFQLSFDSNDLTNTTLLSTYQAAGQVGGFNGAALFFEDVMRSAPFDPTITIPQNAGNGNRSRDNSGFEPSATANLADTTSITPESVAAINEYLKNTADIPLLNQQKGDTGSNLWAISGAKTNTGFPMMANDPHLSLGSPAIFYEIGLRVLSLSREQRLDVYGVSFPGTPTIAQGFNERIQWGSTVNPLDVTDYYQEQVVINSAGVPIATRFRGSVEAINIVPEVFRANQPGNGTANDVAVIAPGTRPSGAAIPPATFVVPRRNNGALITSPAGPNPQQLTAISVQYTGFAATRELETFLGFTRAQNLSDFRSALQSFDVGSQNWIYSDVAGNIAYYTSAEMPLREDLQAGTVDGLPPYFVRDGSGARRNEWIRRDNVPADQALRYEILPFDEMPQLVNPPQGFIANANNDPVGTTLDNNPINQVRNGGAGLYYLSPGYANGNRVGRIDARIRAELAKSGSISFEEMQQIQSDVKLRDAEVLNHYILAAFANANASDAPVPLAAFAHDPAIREAVNRLNHWDFSTPTGISEGYDASDFFGIRLPPSQSEISKSTAATIYSIWRGQILRNTIDASLTRAGAGQALPAAAQALSGLRNLLDNFAANRGRGASGLNFFDVQGVNLSPEAERDIIILQSLKNGLNLLASDAFAPAFNRSVDQNEYRWGKLHRITFAHPLGDLLPGFSIPTGAGFTNLDAALPGISTDGGYETVDASSHNPRAASLNAFMFSSGPARRFVGESRHFGIKAVQVIPGGASGVPSSPWFGNTLDLWLTNEYHLANSLYR
jgi:penicillin amidase